jgi:hypothetical protein
MSNVLYILIVKREKCVAHYSHGNSLASCKVHERSQGRIAE